MANETINRQKLARDRHKRFLINARSEAIGLADAATKIAHVIDEVLEKGGQARFEKQLHYLTGALARLQRDTGAIEELQLTGASQKRSE